MTSKKKKHIAIAVLITPELKRELARFLFNKELKFSSWAREVLVKAMADQIAADKKAALETTP